jgi:hypothetical protein
MSWALIAAPGNGTESGGPPKGTMRQRVGKDYQGGSAFTPTCDSANPARALLPGLRPFIWTQS